MKAAKDRPGCDDTEVLNRPMEWSILVKRAMNARFNNKLLFGVQF
jgi:hypothetical protein